MIKKSLLVAAAAVFFVACGGEGGSANNVVSDIEKNCESKARECTIIANEYKIAGNTQKALELFNKACSGGEGIACYENALIYHKGGIDTKINMPMAYDSYQKACNLNHAESCNVLAILQIGVGQENQSLKNYEKACEAKNANACYNTAVNFYMNGFEGKELKVEADTQKYITLLTSACEIGQIQACDMLSAEFFTGEKTGRKDRNAVGVLCHRACDLNDGGAYTECNRQCDARVQIFDQQAKANAPKVEDAPAPKAPAAKNRKK